MALQTYTYDGPERFHSLVGQVMASLGYVGGREVRDVGAAVTVREEGGHLHVRCTFQDGGAPWSSEARLVGTDRERASLKDCLIHWHNRFCGHGPSPWGTLIGVRPTKLVHHLFDQGFTADQAEKALQTSYCVAPAVARDLVAMARLQRPYVTDRGRKVALYVGIPYCPSHCLYCSFPSRLIGREGEAELTAFRDAVLADLDDLADLCRTYDLEVTSLYVGGGTPTCLPLPVLEAMMTRLTRNFPAAREWTVEAGRPDTATPDMLAMLRQAGVDRISVNPQTLQQHLLDALGRRHRVEDIYTMYENCRKLGFSVINMDFIAGLPGQTVADMQENMEIVCKLHPENVTIHTLALKRGSPLYDLNMQDDIPEEHLVADMIQYGKERLEAAGYVPYYLYRQQYMRGQLENIGYTLPGKACEYNIQIMEERQTIMSMGPGGSSKWIKAPAFRQKKQHMPKDVDVYTDTLKALLAKRHALCKSFWEVV